MKLKTLSFNKTVLKKDITRFAPLWGLYTIFLVILFLSGRSYERVLTASNFLEFSSTIVIVNLIYGGLCANILFGDLFQSRMCNALHAMPLRRESWFANHAFSGLLFSTIPNLIGALLYLVLLQEYWYMALLWLVVADLSFLFFFGLGIFSVMCAGNRLGMTAVYLIINFFSALVYVLAKKVYEPLLYGIELVSDPFLFFCPVYYLSDSKFLSFTYDYYNDRFINGRLAAFYPEVWWYLIVLAFLGIVLAGLAVVLYRKRKLECAGDFLSTKVLEPVFLVICTLACGVLLYAMSSAFGYNIHYIMMAIGIIVGFFAGKMLLQRTVKVFHKRSFLGFAMFCVVLIASLVLAKTDPLRITWYVPDTEDIVSMQVYQDNRRYHYNSNEELYELDTPEQIARFRNVHSQLMAERGAKTDGTSHLYIQYWLKNGRKITRYYSIDEHTAAYEALRMHFSDYRYLFSINNWETVTNNVTSIDLNIDPYMLANYVESEDDKPAAIGSMELEVLTNPEMIAELLEAIHKDCEAGNLSQAYTFHVGEEAIAWFYLSSVVRDENGYISNNGDFFKDITIYPSAVHTTALLTKWLNNELSDMIN